MICEILKDIIIPLLSAFIGGGVTYWGVKKTIAYEKICRKDDEKRYYKPFFVALNEFDDKTKDKITKINFENGEEMYSLIKGYIKNFDFSHFCIEKIEINKIAYIPITNSVIEKNAIVQIEVFGNKKEIQVATLYIRDVLDNQYLYKLDFEENTESSIKIIKKITLEHEV